MANESPHPIQRFTALLNQEWAKLDARHHTELDTEDLLDIFWLAHHIRPDAQVVEPVQSIAPSVDTRQGQKVASPPTPKDTEPKVSVYTPPQAESPTDKQSGLGGGLPLQVPAANALRSPLDLSRALRPLMKKIPSLTQRFLDEEATVVQIAEQGVWSPVMVRAPERWFDLAIVVEDSPSLKLWEDTIAELQTLVEQQGAFRQIRTWGLQGKKGEVIQLSPNWQPTSTPLPPRPTNTLLDPTGRRIIWLVSDCTSDLWDYPAIYECLEKWGKDSPSVIVQLFPERLWSRTALGIGQPMRLYAAAPGASLAMLSAGATPIYPGMVDEADLEGSPQKSITLPVISLEPEPLNRWANVTTGVGDASIAGLKMTLSDLTPQSDVSAPLSPLTPEQRVQQFCATASIAAQKLAGLMAAVPVSLPVAHLIQKTLLPESRQVHLAEVFMGGLLDVIPPPLDQPRQLAQYRFPERVREKLVDAVPISKTTQVMDTVSAHISERLGLGTRSFVALVRSIAGLEFDDQQAIQPFAELGLSTLRRLGGDYRAEADRLAPYLNPSPSEPVSQGWPPLQAHHYQTVTVEVEPLQRFEFETATIEQQRQKRFQKPKWVITKAQGYGWQRVEDLSDGIQLELVEILGGRFQMGSPSDEPERHDDEGPQHEVTLSDFFIGKHPITQAQWRAVAALPQINQELDPDPSSFKGENRPVEQVPWQDAVEFCARLSQKTGRDYGLPTEAEWEYACRAGTMTTFHFGEMITTDLANYDGDSTYNDGPKGVSRNETTPVGSFPANAWGLYDLHGNVWEWCEDHWHDNYKGAPTDGSAWLDKNAETDAARVLRGGSWVFIPWICRSASRFYRLAGFGYFFNGFRVVCRLPRTL